MKIRILEDRNVEFVEQLSTLLTNSFAGTPVDFRVKYCIGEDTENTKGLYLRIDSNLAGNIYEKFAGYASYQFPSDIEEEFINFVVNDLLLAGITFLNIEKIRYVKQQSPQRKVEIGTIYLN